MQENQRNKLLGAGILIALMIIYTLYRMRDPGAASITVGVDTDKIGIVETGQDPVFINLDDVRSVELVDSYDLSGASDERIYASDEIDAYILITTQDAVYVVNSSGVNATERIYQEITDAITE